MMKDAVAFSQVVGVDVSKAKLDVAFPDDKQTLTIDNTEEQIVSKLIGRIDDRSSTIVAMEATGGYPLPPLTTTQGIHKWFLNLLLTKLKTVADTFSSPQIRRHWTSRYVPHFTS
jgi:hypothetical protein